MDTFCTSIASVGITHADAFGWAAIGLGFGVAVVLAVVAGRHRPGQTRMILATASTAFATACALLSVLASVQSRPAPAHAATPTRPTYVLLAPNALASPWAAMAHPGDWSGVTHEPAGGAHSSERPGLRDGKRPASDSRGNSGVDLQKLLHDQEHQQLPAPTRA